MKFYGRTEELASLRKGDFKSRLGKLVTSHLKVLEGV